MLRQALILVLLGLLASGSPHLPHAISPLEEDYAPVEEGHSPDGKLEHLNHVPRGYRETVALAPNMQPRHVHLAYGASTDEVVVTWSTLDKTNYTSVRYGTNLFYLDRVTTSESQTYFPNSPNKATNVQYIHRVHLKNLAPNTTYYYMCGGLDGWSEVFGFKTFKSVEDGNPYPLRLAVFGDLGTTNAVSLTRLQEESHMGMYDAALHCGDYAYDLSNDKGVNGDTYMDMIQPFAAYLPYMTVPGNHEFEHDFHQYRYRFSMPNYQNTESLFYSFDIGPVHFVAVDTEFYYDDDDDASDDDIIARVQKQIEWLESDLEAVDRTVHPWIMMFGHRPMYCSPSHTKAKCPVDVITRIGIKLDNGTYVGNMEDLLWKYNVDIAVFAHVHNYERFYPIYNYTYFTDEDAYFNPRAPVHLVSGAAGCESDITDWSIEYDWSAIRTRDYGYTRMSFLDANTLYIEQVVDGTGEISDSITIVKETHEYPPLS